MKKLTDAGIRSFERLCSKDDLSDSNIASLVDMGLCVHRGRAASSVRQLEAIRAALKASGKESE